MVKLSEGKIRWIVQEKLRRRCTSEIALIQRVSHRRVEQIWPEYKETGIFPQETPTKRRSNRNIRTPSKIIMGNYTR